MEDKVIDKCYAVIGSKGSLDDYFTWIDKVIMSKENAEEYMLFKNNELKIKKEENDKLAEKCNSCFNCDVPESECSGDDVCRYNYSYDIEEQHYYTMEEHNLFE